MTKETKESQTSESQTTSKSAEQSNAQPSANLRNRLVGSIILVGAAIIIIPSVLDGRKVSYKDEFKNVPERAQVQSVQAAKPFPKNEFEQHLPKDETPVTDEEPVDVAELTDFNQAATEQNSESAASSSREVLNTDTIAVNTMSKPRDFSQPQSPGNSTTAQTQKPAESKVTETKKPQQAKASEKSTPFTDNAWVIQLGVFGNKANVAALEKRLNDAGFATFNRDVRYRNGKVLTKVYVGPELDKNVLNKNLNQVNQLAGVKGKVTKFSVNN